MPPNQDFGGYALASHPILTGLALSALFDAMLLIDVLIRYPAITLLLLLAFLSIRDGWSHNPMRYTAGLSIVVSALLLGTSHPQLALPDPLHKFIWLLTTANITWVWWAGRAMFEDNFRLGPLELAGFGALLICDVSSWLRTLYPDSVILAVPMVAFYLCVSVSMMLHLAYVAIKGRDDDMIESRRQFRLYFVLALAIIVIMIILSEKAFDGIYGKDSTLFNTARAGAILGLTLAAVFWLVKAHPEKLAFERLQPLAPAEPKIDPRDALLHERLMTLMDMEKYYTEPGLTIRGLAEKLGAPEHHLRGLINKGLGYRNFSAFLNSYRIDAVKAAMADPENSRIPVLTLAMDVGYNSLAPFNRAFKDVMGMTPSAYRAQI